MLLLKKQLILFSIKHKKLKLVGHINPHICLSLARIRLLKQNSTLVQQLTQQPRGLFQNGETKRQVFVGTPVSLLGPCPLDRQERQSWCASALKSSEDILCNLGKMPA